VIILGGLEATRELVELCHIDKGKHVGEFITGVLDNERRGTNEYLRVAKPGGYVGLNEATWIKTQT